MTLEWSAVMQAIATLLSVVVAAFAVILAIRAEFRASQRFRAEIELQKQVAEANIKPILAVFTSEFLNNKGIVLTNAGIGTAIITNINFSRGDKTVKSMPYLFDFPSKVIWDYFWTFGERAHYLVAGKSIDLIRLTADHLIEHGFSEDKADEILNSMQEQMSGIGIKVEYEDILGNKQKIYERTLQ